MRIFLAVILLAFSQLSFGTGKIIVKASELNQTKQKKYTVALSTSESILPGQLYWRSWTGAGFEEVQADNWIKSEQDLQFDRRNFSFGLGTHWTYVIETKEQSNLYYCSVGYTLW